jgi:hypothetical protein
MGLVAAQITVEIIVSNQRAVIDVISALWKNTLYAIISCLYCVKAKEK